MCIVVQVHTHTRTLTQTHTHRYRFGHTPKKRCIFKGIRTYFIIMRTTNVCVCALPLLKPTLTRDACTCWKKHLIQKPQTTPSPKHRGDAHTHNTCPTHTLRSSTILLSNNTIDNTHVLYAENRNKNRQKYIARSGVCVCTSCTWSFVHTHYYNVQINT